MLKNILLTLYILSTCLRLEAQERRVLLQDKSITLIHYIDYSKPFKSYSGTDYPFTNIFCVEDSGKIDTISLAFANPVGTPVFNGTQLAFMTSRMGLTDFYYCIYEKVDGTWRKIVGHGTGSIYPNEKAELIIKSMFVIEIKAERLSGKIHHEVEFDFVNKVTKRYMIDDNGNRKLDMTVPFPKWKYDKFISRN